MRAHNIVVLIILALLLSITTAIADTIPGGDVFGTWYAANSPYYMIFVCIIAGIMSSLMATGGRHVDE